MDYIYDYISEERKKEIADMNIVDTYNRTGYLDIPGDKVVKSKDEYFLFLSLIILQPLNQYKSLLIWCPYNLLH